MIIADDWDVNHQTNPENLRSLIYFAGQYIALDSPVVGLLKCLARMETS